MSRLRKHVQGQRGESFLEIVRGVDRERIISVAIDVHKYYHLVMIHNGYGDVILPGFEIDIFQAGFDHLCAEIDSVVKETQATVLLIGMEPTGHYFENLARHLLDKYPHIKLVNSYAVKENRNQKMLRLQKNDEIDVCAIGDLVLRNECFTYQPLSEPYLNLQYWCRHRQAKLKMRTMLKNQVIGHLDRIFPGLVMPNGGSTEDQPRLFVEFWQNQTAQHLIRLCPDPRRLRAMSVDQLIDLFHKYGARMGPVTAQRFISFAQQVLLPSEEIIAARLPLLRADLALVEALNAAIKQAEEQMAHYLSQTRASHLTNIKGIGVIHVADYIAGMGNPECYQHAGQIFKRSGLVSGRHDSGLRQKGGKGHKVTKVGDAHLRYALTRLSHSLCQWQPYFSDYRTKLIEAGKHSGIATVATARKANGVLFALLRDQVPFRPCDRHGRPISPKASIRRQQEGGHQP
ncbi:MAG: IS110 family transposase [Ardenticatenia bacterium]|nr:IS110 family transposase [Ardenticatenia bacterium]